MTIIIREKNEKGDVDQRVLREILIVDVTNDFEKIIIVITKLFLKNL